MLHLQNRMLKSSAELSKVEGADERIIKEHASQSAELSRIIALICAEKARQGCVGLEVDVMCDLPGHRT